MLSRVNAMVFAQMVGSVMCEMETIIELHNTCYTHMYVIPNRSLSRHSIYRGWYVTAFPYAH